jgi:hypothetical protein
MLCCVCGFTLLYTCVPLNILQFPRSILNNNVCHEWVTQLLVRALPWVLQLTGPETPYGLVPLNLVSLHSRQDHYQSLDWIPTHARPGQCRRRNLGLKATSIQKVTLRLACPCDLRIAYGNLVISIEAAHQKQCPRGQAVAAARSRKGEENQPLVCYIRA